MISVVVPVYNSEETIAGCIESVLRQSFDALELIVIDDGSSDRSGTICDGYALRDPRIRVVHQPNRGRTEARAVGVSHAKGEWVCFVDSDDQLPSTALADLFERADDTTDIVFGNGYTLPNEQRPVIPMTDFRHLAVRAEGTVGVPWGSLYRRSLLAPYLFDIPRHIVNGEDYLFWLRLVFSIDRPVNVVYKKVYEKGDEHTSNSFKWTADYCYELNELRKASIPEKLHDEFMADMTNDRLANMFSVAQWSRRSEWASSRYYRELLSDMAAQGRRLSLKNRLFLALPSLHLRRLYAWASQNMRYTGWHGACPYMLFLLVAGIAMLLLNLLDAPTLSDDMIYRFKWNADESAAVERIETIGDLLSSQFTHYLTTNGRFPAHLLAQTFLVFVPPAVTQVLNSLLFVMLLHFSTCLIAKPGQRLFVAVVVCFLLFIVFQGFRTTMVWSLGAFNYLWVLVATLGFLLYLRDGLKQAKAPAKSLFRHWLLAPLAILVGWSHEALSLPVSVAFAAWLVLGGRKSWRSAAAPYMVFYILGCSLCLLTPAVWNRSAEAASLQGRLLSGAMNCLFNIRIAWLLLVTLFILWWRRRPFLYDHLRRFRYVYVALLVSMGIVLLCGTSLERVAFFTDFMAMLLLLPLLQELLSVVWQRRLVIVSCVLMLLSFVPAYMVRKENNDSWLLAERQMKTPGRELIAVTTPMKGENAVMDYFRNHYVNSSFEFGFYCSYMAFDANDINMRCAARLYDKQHMYFLPADVVRRAEADSTAYTNYGLDEHGALYVWKMPSHSEVDSLVFLLNDEDPSTLNPLQRLVAWHDSVYELDDFNYEVVDIGTQSYLVFTRPTTNIYRRIKNIKYRTKQ